MMMQKGKLMSLSDEDLVLSEDVEYLDTYSRNKIIWGC